MRRFPAKPAGNTAGFLLLPVDKTAGIGLQ